MSEERPHLLDGIRAAIESYDRDSTLSLALDAVTSGKVTIPELYDVLAELLVRTGAEWRSGELTVWQEHFATAVVRTIIEACHPLVNEFAEAPNGRTVLLATPPEEYHDLGLRMTADRFELAGWTAHLLGASLPVSQLSLAVAALGADAVVLSASTHFHRIALRPYVLKLLADHPGLTVWVTGAAFAEGAEGWPHGCLLDPARIPELTVQAESC